MKRVSIYHGLLVYYLREKNRIIVEKCGVSLIEEGDIDEIRDWTEKKVKKFFDHMKQICSVIGDLEISYGDINICPWCVHSYIDKSPQSICKTCNYGKRHIKCVFAMCYAPIIIQVKPDSTYSNVLNSLRDKKVICKTEAISSIREIIDLVRSVNSLYTRISDDNFTYEDVIKQII